MPRKVFVAGEILTAADVNTNLMDQSVMVFDDSAARGSAIPTPSEGMVTYLKDDDEVTVYDGSTFKSVGAGLVETKSVVKTNIFSASVAAGANVALTDLSITHTLKNSANKLVFTAFFGKAAISLAARRGAIGIAIANDGNLLNIGDADGTRSRTTAGGFSSTDTVGGEAEVAIMPHISYVYSPGDTSSHTYTVRAINLRNNTQTLFVNRSSEDGNDSTIVRAASAFTLMEVSV